MGRGNPIVKLRLSPDLHAGVLAALRQANQYANVRTGPKQDLSAWLRKAIEQKLAHLARAKAQNARRRERRRTAREGVAGRIEAGAEVA